MTHAEVLLRTVWRMQVSEMPLVSVITPSFNMGLYIEETIRSVLAQDYPKIEYIVMDAGSTDGTLAVLERYHGQIQYHLQPDRGAADAINKGFAKAHGQIFAYLNADDTYLPGAVSSAVRELLENPEAAAVYGDGYWVDGGGRTIGPYPTKPFDPQLLTRECFICQPATFIRRNVFEQVGLMDPALQFTFDYDLWIRIGREHRMRKIDRFLATSRMHKLNKTIGQRKPLLIETMNLLRGHFDYVPRPWIFAYVSYVLDGKDQFFERSDLSLLAYALALFVGLRRNARHPFRFFREWAGTMTLTGLVHRCNRFRHSLSR